MINQLGSRYPIVAMAMNRLSDVKLACAVEKAGAIPSLSVYNYYTDPKTWNVDWLRQELETYMEITNGANIMLSVGIKELLDPNIQQAIKDYRIKLIELIPDSIPELVTKNESVEGSDVEDRYNQIRTIVNELQGYGTKCFVKVLNVNDINEHQLLFDGVILKGPAGAGRIDSATTSLEQLFDDIHARYPGLLIIVSGGIGTSEQVQYYINKGAIAVGIGTMLAVSKESRMSEATKQQVINSSADSITTFKTGAEQNAIVFSYAEHDSYNHTRGLAAGLADPNQGHVFVGHGIKNVTEVLTVSDIIQSLVKDL